MVCDLISLHHHMIILASFFFLLCAAVTMARRIIISCCKQSFALKFYEAYHAHFLRAIMCLNVWKNFAVVSRGAQGWWAPQFTVFENHKKSLICQNWIWLFWAKIQIIHIKLAWILRIFLTVCLSKVLNWVILIGNNTLFSKVETTGKVGVRSWVTPNFFQA